MASTLCITSSASAAPVAVCSGSQSIDRCRTLPGLQHNRSRLARHSLTSDLCKGFEPAPTACRAAPRTLGNRGIEAKVSVGDQAPGFSLQDQNGRTVSLSKLKGKNVVLYFYPKDDTPGCTKQACSFRDSFDAFRSLGAEVIGISKDSPASHKTFAAKYNLPYTLLSDEDEAVRKAYGIPADLFGVLPGRQTYVVDKKGIVQLIFNNQFQPEKHVAETVKLLETLKEEKTGFQLPKFF